MKKIGIYGGSFDPIHHGHLILARSALEMLELERIIFVLAAQAPHKSASPSASAEVRWEMLKAAIEDEPGFVASRLELDRPPPSYTIDTIEQLRRENAYAEFFFLVGEDNLSELAKWHRIEELRRLVHFVVLDRTGIELEHEFRTVQRKIDISATAIRNRVASGLSIRYLVPEMVERIIRREKLYQGAKR